MFSIIFFLIYFSIFQIQAFTISQLEVAKYMSDELARRQIIVVKNISEQTNKESLAQIVKYFSNFKIYTTFRSVNEMDSTLSKLVSIEWPTHQHYPTTIAIIDGDVLSEIAKSSLIIDKNPVTPMIVWMAFDNSTENFINRINGSYIPYNCQFLLINQANNSTYEIFELYDINVYTRNFFVTRVGIWNKDNGLDEAVNDFYNRRFDLNNTVFGVYTDCDAELREGSFVCPFTELSDFATLITFISEMMNFRCEYVYVYENDSYDKFLKEFPDSVVEFYIDDLSMFDAVYYISEMLHIRTSRGFFHVSYQKIYEKGMTSPFIKPFTQKLWLSVGAWLIVSTLFVLLMNFIAYRKQKQIRYPSLLDICFASFESFTNQCGSGNNQEAESFRMAMFMIQIPPLFLVSAYSGIIIAFITVRIIVLPFQDLEGLLEDGSFKIGYLKDTFPGLWFNDTNDLKAKLAYEKFAIDEEDMPDGWTEGVNKMCDDPKFSLIGLNDDYFQYKYKCEPLQIRSSLFVSNTALLLREYTPFKNIFSRIIYKFRSVGIIHRLETTAVYFDDDGLKAINGENYPTKKSFDVDFVNWDAVESIFIVLGMAYLTSIVILLLECYISRKLSKKKI